MLSIVDYNVILILFEFSGFHSFCHSHESGGGNPEYRKKEIPAPAFTGTCFRGSLTFWGKVKQTNQKSEFSNPIGIKRGFRDAG